MHYITKLKTDNELLKDWIRDLSRYVYSDKFSGPELSDKMINKNDIILRINELELDIDINKY